MAKDDLMEFINEHATGAGKFTPYHEYSKESDALTVRLNGDADYSQRLTDHVTVYLSLDTGEIVGCRIKGISDLIEDLPNYIKVDGGDISLSVMFLAFRGGIHDESIREAFNKLAKASAGMKLQHA